MNLTLILTKHKAIQVGNAVYAFVNPTDAIHAHNEIQEHHSSLDVQCHDDRLWFGNHQEAKLKIGQELLQSWIDKQKHDRCWFYPDIFMQLCQLHGLTVNMTPDMTEEEFEKGCAQFRKELFNAANSSVGSVHPGTHIRSSFVGLPPKQGGI
jgi:hypothetical protein